MAIKHTEDHLLTRHKKKYMHLLENALYNGESGHRSIKSSYPQEGLSSLEADYVFPLLNSVGTLWRGNSPTKWHRKNQIHWSNILIYFTVVLAIMNPEENILWRNTWQMFRKSFLISGVLTNGRVGEIQGFNFAFVDLYQNYQSYQSYQISKILQCLWKTI